MISQEKYTKLRAIINPGNSAGMVLEYAYPTKGLTLRRQKLPHDLLHSETSKMVAFFQKENTRKLY